ncbi:MAG: DUF1476 domain-containing protein [Pseudomonadota bacterium]
MNGSFKDREKAAEAKFQHDQETTFKAQARRNRLLGLWAAELLGLVGTDAETYAKEVIAADFEKPGDADVLEKVFQDFQKKGLDISEHRVRKEMDRFLQIAFEQITSG